MRYAIGVILLVSAAALAACQGDRARVQDNALIEPTDDPGPGLGLTPPGDGYLIDGMVGQINGRPIFADTVFHGDDPIHDQLGALGRRLPRPVFRERAGELIVSRLRQMVLDSLILAEAERDLNDQERAGLRRLMQQREQELIRLHGQGSASAARANILERTGQTLDAALEDFRRRVVVQRHIAAVIEPKINVTRRDIERYYRDNVDQFNPEPTRTLRLIRVDTAVESEEVAQRLGSGEAFAAVADAAVNKFTAAGGLFEGAIGDEAFAYPALNEAMTGLSVGAWDGPLSIEGDFWFVYLEAIDRPRRRTLPDAQLDIEQTLKRRARQRETDRYYQQLLADADPDAVPRMAEALVEIAVSRYAAGVTATDAE